MAEANNQPLISVIVPVYNVEAYITACIESVLSQSYSNWELILVDDGSSDGSREIMNRYAAQHTRIRCMDYGMPPWNRGVSTARNCGLRAAAGSWCCFLDSDDMLESDYLMSLYAATEQMDCDIVYCGFSRWDGEKHCTPFDYFQTSEVLSGADFLGRKLDNRDNQFSAGGALYSTAFLRKNQLCFDEDIRLYEDVLFMPEAAIHARHVRTIPMYGYLYRIRQGSQVQDGIQKRDADGMQRVIGKLMAVYRDNPTPAMGRYMIAVISIYLYYLGDLQEQGILTRQEQKAHYQYLTALMPLSMLRRAAKTKRERVKCLLWRINWKLFYPLVKKR